MGRFRDSSRSTLLAVIALTALAAVLRFVTLGDQSFWADEAVTVHLLGLDLGTMLDRIPDSESTPPLYYLLAWLWSKPFGLGEFGLRSLSALFGTATVPLAFLAARELCSRRVGLAVAALAAVNPVLIWYSQEARAYALLTALTALSLWAFARLLRRATAAAAVTWAAASALALASHYFAAFLVIPEAIWLAAAAPGRRRLLPAVAAVAVAALALLPLALHQRSLDLASFIKGDALVFRLARAGKNLLVGFDSPLEQELAVIAVLIALVGMVGAFAWARGRERSGARVALVLGLLMLGLPLLLAAVGADYLDTRNLLPAWIPLMTVVVAGLLPLGRAGVAALVLLGLLGLAGAIGTALEPAWQREDWRGMARALGPPDGPRVVIAPATGRRPLDIYLGRLPELPRGGVKVREVALLYPVRRKSGEVHPLPPPRLNTSAPQGFTLARRRVTDGYAVTVLRAPRPTNFGVLAALALRPSQDEPTAIMLQR
jgi:mannosyltransferase